jgi:hypothetical protein
VRIISLFSLDAESICLVFISFGLDCDFLAENKDLPSPDLATRLLLRLDVGGSFGQQGSISKNVGLVQRTWTIEGSSVLSIDR